MRYAEQDPSMTPQEKEMARAAFANYEDFSTLVKQGSDNYKAKLTEEGQNLRAKISADALKYKAFRDTEKTDAAEGKQDEKLFKQLSDHLNKGWAARGGQAGQVQSKINAAQAAEALIEQGATQENGLDSRQIEELAQSTARLLGGGATASARVEALVPKTLKGEAQSLKEFITGNPQGSQQQAFVERLAETVKRERELAEDQKRTFQVEGLADFSTIADSPRYQKMIQSRGISPDMIDESGSYKKTSKKVDPKKAQMIKTLEAEMKNPDAARANKAKGIYNKLKAEGKI